MQILANKKSPKWEFLDASPLREHEPFKARSYKGKIQLFQKNHRQDYFDLILFPTTAASGISTAISISIEK